MCISFASSATSTPAAFFQLTRFFKMFHTWRRSTCVVGPAAGSGVFRFPGGRRRFRIRARVSFSEVSFHFSTQAATNQVPITHITSAVKVRLHITIRFQTRRVGSKLPRVVLLACLNSPFRGMPRYHLAGGGSSYVVPSGPLSAAAPISFTSTAAVP